MSVLASLFLALSLGDPLPPATDHVVNADFDTGIEGWRYFLDDGAGGRVDWDATSGAPGLGSALVGNLFHGARRDGWWQCVTLSPGDFTARVAVASQVRAGNQCSLRVQVVDHADCTFNAPVVLDRRVANTINDGTFETVTITATAPSTAGAVAITLEHLRAASAPIGASDCRFDHVELLTNAVFASGFGG